jgi:hypothetical protein
MPRQRQRACLQHGLKLDLNRLVRQGLIKPGAQTGPFTIRWTNTYWQEEIASGLISADMQGKTEGSLHIQIGELDQTIIRVASRRLGKKLMSLPQEARTYRLSRNRGYSPASILLRLLPTLAGADISI